MLSSQTLFFFRDELEKLGAGPKFIEDPSMIDRGVVGFHVRRKTIDAAAQTNPAVADEIKRFGFKPGQDAIMMTPKEKLRQVYTAPGHADAAYNVTRRHEMTHWMRARRGKMEGFGEPGVRNVLKTGREEAAAHLSALKTRGLSEVQRERLFKASGAGLVGSMKSAYPGGVGKAMLGGKLGKGLKALKLLR